MFGVAGVNKDKFYKGVEIGIILETVSLSIEIGSSGEIHFGILGVEQVPISMGPTSNHFSKMMHLSKQFRCFHPFHEVV